MPDSGSRSGATSKRKDAHLDLCATEEVAPKENSTLFECVKLIHCAMPELAVADVQLSTRWFGKPLKAPLLITGMTGGSERSMQVNRDLAAAAEACGVAFGLGSQRAMAEDPSLAKTFSVREVAKETVVVGNLGLAQAAKMNVDAVRKLVDAVGADALALHLNPAQELTQPEGDRDFKGGYATVEKLAKAFGERLVVKETGCGIAPEVARRLVDLGVRHLDVSGLGGTSWVRVEQLRATGIFAEVGKELSSWGIPTAAAVALVRRAVGPNVTVVASGGLRSGVDLAKALALGADLGGMALPMFKAQQAGGVEGVVTQLSTVIEALRQVMVLTGSATIENLRKKPKVKVGELKEWLAAY